MGAAVIPQRLAPPPLTAGPVTFSPSFSPSHAPMEGTPSEERLRKEATTKALSVERDRITSLEAVESNYTTLDEFRAALKRERRRSARLAADLAIHRWDAVSVQAAAEVTEESRVNALVRHMTRMKEERSRLIVELEREEECIANRLMGRLEAVRREKRLLELQIEEGGAGGVGAGNGFGGGGYDDGFGHDRGFGSFAGGPPAVAYPPPTSSGVITAASSPSNISQAEAQSVVATEGGSNGDQSLPSSDSAGVDAKPTIPAVPNTLDVAIRGGHDEGDDKLVEEEEEGESEDEEDHDDWGGQYDPETEKELQELLQKKNLG